MTTVQEDMNNFLKDRSRFEPKPEQKQAAEKKKRVNERATAERATAARPKQYFKPKPSRLAKFVRSFAKKAAPQPSRAQQIQRQRFAALRRQQLAQQYKPSAMSNSTNERLLSTLRARQNLGHAANQNLVRHRRDLETYRKAANLMKAHENMTPFNMNFIAPADIMGNDSTNIMKDKPNSIHINQRRPFNILETKKAGNNLKF